MICKIELTDNNNWKNQSSRSGCLCLRIQVVFLFDLFWGSLFTRREKTTLLLWHILNHLSKEKKGEIDHNKVLRDSH